MGKIKDLYVNTLIEQLAKEGERIMRECLQERDYTHQTYNLHDSYGYAVYYKGSIKKSGKASPQATQAREIDGEKISGERAIADYLNSYNPSNGIELIIVAAMPYATELEHGQGLRRKYKVVSMSYDKLREVQGSFLQIGAQVFRIDNGVKEGGVS